MNYYCKNAMGLEVLQMIGYVAIWQIENNM